MAPQAWTIYALEMLILRTLALEPMHGYAVAQHIHRLSREAAS